jgi:ketosteroid isomerase-like protein
MNHIPPDTLDKNSQSIGLTAKAIVEEFLRIIMIPDPEGARALVAPELEIHFTGGRLMHDPRECSAFNASRYKWVKKRFERTDVVADASDDEAIVYNIGTLYGQWPDGEPFECNRYVDRYVVRHGKIIRMEVWNDSAERMLSRAGLCAPWLAPV